MAYFLYPDIPGDSASYFMKWIDGDRKKVSVIDIEPDGGTAINSFVILHFLCGRPVHPEFMPTKMRSSFSGKIHPDYVGAAGGGFSCKQKV